MKRREEERLGLLCRCNETGTVRGFIKVRLNDEDLDAHFSSTLSIFSCEEVPERQMFKRKCLIFAMRSHLYSIFRYLL